MHAYVYPADAEGCGSHRLIWPSYHLGMQGHHVTVVTPGQREVSLMLRNGEVASVAPPEDCDVMVLQRVTNRWMMQAIPLLRAQGVAVVVDVDDDLTAIHPTNPAWQVLHPANEGRINPRTGEPHMHNWDNLTVACEEATMVTVSAPALLRRYAAHGRGRVIHNYLHDHYYGVPHMDSEVIGWPAALASHPDDPSVVGNAIARLVQEGADFVTTANPTSVGFAYGLPADPLGVWGNTTAEEWPGVVSEMLGIGIAPLAPTVFNASKSWLKPLEMSALGIPWVGSPRPEYRRLHELGCGVLANNANQWYSHLQVLRRNEQLRKELAAAGQVVAEGLRLAANVWRHWEAWEDAVALQRA